MSLKRAFALSIDFSKTNHINTSIKFKQFDYGGNEIGLQILYDGDVIVLDDTDVVMAVYRDSKNNIIVDNNYRPVKSFARVYDLNKGLIIMPVNRDVLKLAGKVDVELMIISSDGAKRITSPRFDFEVIQSILDFKEDDIQTRETVCGLYKCGEVLCGKTVEKTSKIYTKNIWIDGQTVIDAEKLNNIENGIESLNSRMDEDKSYIEENFSPKSHRHSAGDIDEQITAVRVNGETYSQVDGVITLPDYPTGGVGEIVTNVEPLDDDIPKIFFNGQKPTSKTSVFADIEYISKTERFKGYVDIKCQGTSSMSYPKKNYTIKMYTDNTKTKKLKKDFKGWGKQNKFCLKANYIDHSHARNICSAKLWGQITESRAGYEELPELLRTSPNNGAIDGFPIKVYYNNSYEGVYTLNIPKDKWMFNMDDDLENHAVLCGEEYNSGCFRTVNASVWSDEIHDVMPQSIKTSFENFQRFVINSTDEEFKANIENYAYLDSLIDYYIFQYAICGLDSMGKNQLFATYDGTKWIATSYDMDSTFGLYWNGQSYVSATYRMQQDYESGKNTGGQGNVLYNKIEKLYPNEIKARYNELRAGALSYTNVVNVFEPFMDIIGKDLYAEDLTIYTGIPSGNTNNITQIRNYFRDRLVYVDAQIAGLQEPTPSTPCTSIRLDKSDIILGHDEGVKVNLLEGLEYEINVTNGNDATYNIQLESGRYCLRNINEGVYKWLACKRLAGNDVVTGRNKTDGIVFDIETKGTYKIVFNIGSETSVNLNKIELCKWNDVEEGEALEFTQAGKGWFNASMNIQEEGTSTNDVYSDEVVVNPSKTYILRDTTENRNYGSSTYSENGPCLIVTNSEGVSSYVKPTYAHGILIENCSKIKFSINKNYHREINAFQIVEVEKESVSGKILSAKLTATVTPANTTDVIKWSVNPTGICAVNNGIVTAKKNGECVVKATCGTQSATCNVTVRGIEEVVSAIEYELESPLVCDGN